MVVRRSKLARRDRKAMRQGSTSDAQFTRKRFYDPIEVLSQDDLHVIHDKSMELLENDGIEFMSEDAWKILEENGAIVDKSTGIVRIPRRVMEHCLKTVPKKFTIKARNSTFDGRYGEGETNCTQAMSTFVTDIDEGRRIGSTGDYQNFLKLCQTLDSVDVHGGYTGDPQDRDQRIKHYDNTFDLLTLSDKSFRVYPIGTQLSKDVLYMTATANGLSTKEFSAEPRCWMAMSINSPRRIDKELLEGAIIMARHNQVIASSTVAMLGAMVPISISGALILGNAEVLSGIAFAQMVNPGTPCLYSLLIMTTDMKSGAPAFSSPEHMLGSFAAGQMARYYEIPRRSCGGGASNAPDAQAGFENTLSQIAGFYSGADMLFCAQGMLESALTTSYEQLILDCEVTNFLRSVNRGMRLDDADDAVASIREAGIGGHFFATKHTLSRFETEHWSPTVAKRESFGNWEAGGKITSANRANQKWKQMLKDFEPPDMDADIIKELESFVDKRKKEILKLD